MQNNKHKQHQCNQKLSLIRTQKGQIHMWINCANSEKLKIFFKGIFSVTNGKTKELTIFPII